jgi:hypothetical protein
MTRASYLESARVMPLGARQMAWICAAEWAGFVAAVDARAIRRGKGIRSMVAVAR